MRRRVVERLRRLRREGSAKYWADLGAFYLPYVEEAIAAEPELRVVCLERPREEAITGLCRRLEQTFPYPIDNWSARLLPPWRRDFLGARSFPKYEAETRYEALCRYWDDYHAEVKRLVAKYPRNVRLWDTSALTSEAGVTEVLDFVGIAPEDRVIVTGEPAQTETWSPQRINTPQPDRFPHPMDPRRCVVLVPYQGLIHRECEEGLKELERRGYEVRRVQGYAAIDQGRNQLATDALLDGFQEILWVDSDVAFHPDSVDQLRSHPQWIVCGIYPQKNKRALASHVLPGTPSMKFGKEGGLQEILYAGTGFLLVRREAFWKIFEDLQLPICNEGFDRASIPFYMPMVREVEDSHWYLAEDYAFGERARQCGINTYADTRIRLWHIGNYRYGWEDAGMERPRFATFTMHFQRTAADDEPTTAMSPLEERLAGLASDFPWPDACPNAPLRELPVNPSLDAADLLSQHITPHTRLILELGAGAGHLTRLLATHPSGGTVLAVEDWPHANRPESEEPPATTAQLESFLTACWEARRKIVPIAQSYVRGLQIVADAGLRPNVIVVNDHHQQQLKHELLAALLEYFPGTTIIGNGFDEARMGPMLQELADERRRTLRSFPAAWLLQAK